MYTKIMDIDYLWTRIFLWYHYCILILNSIYTKYKNSVSSSEQEDVYIINKSVHKVPKRNQTTTEVNDDIFSTKTSNNNADSNYSDSSWECF